MRRTQFTISINHVRYFNPRTPYGMRRTADIIDCNTTEISIHAPLTGCDIVVMVGAHTDAISIHAPLTGCDLEETGEELTIGVFQSTHPLRDATSGYFLVATKIM